VSTTVEPISDPARLTTLRSEWTELVGDSAADSLFLTWEWMSTWWKHHARGRRLALLAVREGRDLVGLAPLARRTTRPNTLASAWLEFLGSGVVGSDYLDVILRRGREPLALSALSEALDSEGLRLDLVRVPAESASMRTLAGSLSARGWLTLEALTHVCPFIPLEGQTWESYLMTLGPSHRSTVRRRLRQAQAGAARFRIVDAVGERQPAFDALVRLHGLRWGDRSETFCAPATVAFHEEMMAVALDRGWLRLGLLTQEGTPLAVVYGLRYRDTLYYFQSGFDPRHAAQSPGLVALGLSIKSALEEGVRRYDLLHGDEPYKFRWARAARTLSRVELYPATVRETVHALTRVVGRRARQVARQVLPVPVAAWLREMRRRQWLESVRCSAAS
jgi:CelD/BcsL family acetyltransferase involved in cellulose biosynthesis